jgi:hypothetical protein
MEAKELRIGNYVHHNKGWSYRCCDGDFDFIWNESDWHALGECTLDLSNIKPIILTEYWLVKFGFKKEMDGSWVLNNLAIFLDKRIKENVYLMIIEGGVFGSELWNELQNLKLKHVHQLQNFIFALTNQELTIKN